MTGDPGHVTVIGSGIVGVSCALFLQREGHSVTIVDPAPAGSGASFGNAGAVARGAVTPTSTPGLWKDVPGMLLDPLGPLQIRWTYLPRILPWLIRFLQAGRPARVEEISRSLLSLLTIVDEAYDELLKGAGLQNMLIPNGWLKVYESEHSFRAASFERDLMERRGVPFDVLDAAALRQLEPTLSKRFKYGVYQTQSRFAVDPGGMVKGLARDFEQRGGTLLPEKVTGIRLTGRTGRTLVTDAGERELDRLVIAAGAWSRPLVRQLGEDVPLDTERGYHLSLTAEDQPPLRHPTFVGDHRFVLSPTRTGLRLTSGVEFAGLHARPDYSWVERLLPIAQEVLPGLKPEITSRWLGFRPSTPDSLPVISRSPKHPWAYYAFGHGHLGITLGPATGYCISRMISGADQAVDMRPFGIERFRR